MRLSVPVDFVPRLQIIHVARRVGRWRELAIVVQPGRVAADHQTEIAELAAKNRLPAMYHRADFVEAGGLMTYGVNIEDLDRRAATYVDKILKGAKPAELPVEQPKKFELIINLTTAMAW